MHKTFHLHLHLQQDVKIGKIGILQFLPVAQLLSSNQL